MASKKRALRNRDAVFVVSLFLFIVATVGAVSFLSSNSREAKRRYDVLVAADAANGDTETALRELRSYIYSHMNTTIGSPNGIYPPIQLKGTYERLLVAEQQRVRATNEKLYDEATSFCEGRFPSGQLANGRVQCVSEYVASRGVVERVIPDAAYKFNFASPVWSPDAAGFFILAAAVLSLNLLMQIVLEIRLRSHLRHN